MRYGVVNDNGGIHYMKYGKAIEMPDRQTPVLEFGYQRCNEPPSSPNAAPNDYSRGGHEVTPRVGGDIIVTFKHGFTLPIYNTVVANHARISFISDSLDHLKGGEYVDTYIRTDLLRIRNKVEFYTDPAQAMDRVGKLQFVSYEYMETMTETGIYPHHLHMEPGSELSLVGDDSIEVVSTTTVGGYGHIHENILLEPNATIAPGFASLMEFDCSTPNHQGKLTIHNLTMRKDAVVRISIGNNNCVWDKASNTYIHCTQADTLQVKDTILFYGEIPLYVLPEEEYIEPGCYLFMIYDSTVSQNKEYINNLTLMTTRHGEYFFSLSKSENGRVYLCVTDYEIPDIQRYILIEKMDGITTDPVAGIQHYVFGHHDFNFTVTYLNRKPLEVWATGFYSNKVIRHPATRVSEEDGIFAYKIPAVVEPWHVTFGDVDRSFEVGNSVLNDQRVWAYRSTLYINVNEADVVSIYNATGVLYQKLEIPAGLKKLTLDKGVYMVMLKDGSVHKIIIN